MRCAEAFLELRREVVAVVPIYDCSNVVMTSHTSGWSPDRQVRLIDLFAENVRRYALGPPLINVVDKQRMY